MTALDPGRLLRRLVAAGAVAAGAMVGLGTTPASAEIVNEGLSCHGSIAGTSVLGIDSQDTSQAIPVSKDSSVVVTMSSDQPITEYRVELSFAFVGWTVADNTTSSQQWQNSVKVNDYAHYGVGLYRVVATSTGPSGSCRGAALVRVEGGQPVPDTIAGDVGAGLSTAGLLGLLGVGLSSGGGGGDGGGGDGGGGDGGDGGGGSDVIPVGLLTPEEYDACVFFVLPALLMTIGFMAMGGGPGGPAPARKLPRARWRPRISFVGLVSSVIGALGVLVVLQQYSKVFPTTGVVIRAGIAAVVVGIAVPSLLRLIPVRRHNRRVAAYERAMAARSGAPPSPAP